MAEDVKDVGDLYEDSERHLLEKIANADNALAAERWARAYRYLSGGPQPGGSIEVKS